MTGVQVLVLAAGAGSRFRAAGGDDKLQAPLPGHPESTVLQATFRLWKSLDLPCLAVVASGAPWRAELAREEGLEVLTLPTTGMGDSLAAAVRATPQASGWLVALGDMPFVQPATARQLLALHDPARVVVPVFQEKRGHPVLFGRNFAAALGDLQGDEGAKRLLRQASVLERKVTDAGIHLDIDTPADLKKTPSVALELPHFAVLPTQENAIWGKTIMNTIEFMLDYLKTRELQLTTAESCTAGKVVGLLSEIPGSGSCIESGYVVYSPEAKQRLLGVKPETIERYNLTSEEVAREMAEGALRDSPAQIAIANTGLAGPGGADGIPQGTVCFAWGYRVGDDIVLYSETQHFAGDREAVQLAAARHSLNAVVPYHQRLERESKENAR